MTWVAIILGWLASCAALAAWLGWGRYALDRAINRIASWSAAGRSRAPLASRREA